MGLLGQSLNEAQSASVSERDVKVRRGREERGEGSEGANERAD